MSKIKTWRDRVPKETTSFDYPRVCREAADAEINELRAGCLHKDALIDSLTAERDALAVKLKRIADLDPEKDSDAGFNEWGEAHCFNVAQFIAKDKS